VRFLKVELDIVREKDGVTRPEAIRRLAKLGLLQNDPTITEGPTNSAEGCKFNPYFTYL